jgi:predicted nucleic acid-binding Zn ribbon protein
MKRHNTQKLGEVLKEVLQNQQLDTKLFELQLIQSWEKVLGPIVQKYTTNIYINNKKLYVNLSSSILRNDLMLSREKLIEALNKQAGASVINDIVFR